jgi:hypothetical protein
VAVCAILSGAASFAAIGEWVADLPAEARIDLGLGAPIPGPVTIWRVLTRIDPASLETAIGTWIRARLVTAEAAAPAPPTTARIPFTCSASSTTPTESSWPRSTWMPRPTKYPCSPSFSTRSRT